MVIESKYHLNCKPRLFFVCTRHADTTHNIKACFCITSMQHSQSLVHKYFLHHLLSIVGYAFASAENKFHFSLKCPFQAYTRLSNELVYMALDTSVTISATQPYYHHDTWGRNPIIWSWSDCNNIAWLPAISLSQSSWAEYAKTAKDSDCSILLTTLSANVLKPRSSMCSWSIL